MNAYILLGQSSGHGNNCRDLETKLVLSCNYKEYKDSPDHLNDLTVAVTIVRLESEAVDLPENHSERPDIRLCGELAVQDTLRWHPSET